MKKSIMVLVVVIMLSMLLPMSVAAASSSTYGNWLASFLCQGVPFLINLKGRLTIQYTNYASPWPGYYQVYSNNLFAEIPNYYDDNLNVQPPFTIVALVPALQEIKRYDNGVLNMSLTSFTYPYPQIGDYHSRSKYGYNTTNSYLSKESGSQYSFVGTVRFISLCIPDHYDFDMTKTFSFN